MVAAVAEDKCLRGFLPCPPPSAFCSACLRPAPGERFCNAFKRRTSPLGRGGGLGEVTKVSAPGGLAHPESRSMACDLAS